MLILVSRITGFFHYVRLTNNDDPIKMLIDSIAIIVVLVNFRYTFGQPVLGESYIEIVHQHYLYYPYEHFRAPERLDIENGSGPDQPNITKKLTSVSIFRTRQG